MKVHIGPGEPSELRDAVCSAGAELSSAADAQALVWFGAGPERFGELVHPGLEWVQLPSAGIESWIGSGSLPEGITITSAVGSYADTVAEHALGMMLAGARELHTHARCAEWTAPRGPRTLFGATVGIIGAGGIGRALIGLLAPFGGRVLATNRSGEPVAGAERTWPASDPVGLRELLAESDFVVVAAPATPDTERIVDANALAAMKDDAWLLNVARGSLVDTEALVEALDEARIGGAALDVTDPEPLPADHPLWSSPRALITSHSANPRSMLMPALARRVRENVRRRMAGEPLVGVVDRTAGY
ncbi:NAD(P)-dependent oxidoreductase [Parasphingorhabdus pacifica]